MKNKLLVAAGIVIALSIVLFFIGKTEAPGSWFGNDTKSSDTKTAKPAFDTSKYSTTDPSSRWIVVNKQRPLNPKEFAPSDLVAVGGGQMLRKEAADALSSLQSAAQKNALYILPLSGFRTFATQANVYSKEVAANGQTVADTQSARAGYSEHQTGLAIDVGGGGCGIEDCFATTKEGKWLAQHAHEFGFIIRYPKDKQTITGYRYEPWHIRYVGKELAKEIIQTNKTLEEIFGLKAAPTY